MPDPDVRVRARVRGLLLDFGGVLTTSMGRAFSAFCVSEGVDPERFKTVISEAYGTDGSQGMVGKLERGEIELDEFETWLAEHLSEGLETPLPAGGIRDRMFAGMLPDEAMMEAVRLAHAAGVKTGLISNSWGPSGFHDSELADAFDAVLISGEVGMRKPDPEIFIEAARLIGLEPAECVFVDDLEQNAAGARAVGMHAIVHRSARFTVPKLEELLGVELTDATAPRTPST
jgi:putative hydrolase of the HAD superfamily